MKFEFHGNWTIEANSEKEAWEKFGNTDEADNYWIDSYYDKESGSWKKFGTQWTNYAVNFGDYE